MDRGPTKQYSIVLQVHAERSNNGNTKHNNNNNWANISILLLHVTRPQVNVTYSVVRREVAFHKSRFTRRNANISK